MCLGLLYSFKAIIVIRSDCAHYPIPKEKVQSVVALEVHMMLVVINGSVDPLPYPTFRKACRIEFVAQMPVDIVQHHEQQEDANRQRMNRKEKNYHHNDSSLHHGFEWMKRHSGPGRWIG